MQRERWGPVATFAFSVRAQRPPLCAVQDYAVLPAICMLGINTNAHARTCAVGSSQLHYAAYGCASSYVQLDLVNQSVCVWVFLGITVWCLYPLSGVYVATWDDIVPPRFRSVELKDINRLSTCHSHIPAAPRCAQILSRLCWFQVLPQVKDKQYVNPKEDREQFSSDNTLVSTRNLYAVQASHSSNFLLRYIHM